MSRYGFTPTTKVPGNDPADATQEVIVGWDNPLQTFFGDVANANGDELVSTMIGMSEFNVQTVDDLEYLIGLAIPASIRVKLIADQDQRTDPTPLQRQMGAHLK